MPRYRAHIEYRDKFGREHSRTIEFDSPSDNSEDVAPAAQAAWRGFQQQGEEHLPHNIRWERIGDGP